MPRRSPKERYEKVCFRWPPSASRALEEVLEYLAKNSDVSYTQGEAVAIYFLKAWNTEKAQQERRSRKELLKVAG